MNNRPDPFEIWLAVLFTAFSIPLIIMLWRLAL